MSKRHLPWKSEGGEVQALITESTKIS